MRFGRQCALALALVCTGTAAADLRAQAVGVAARFTATAGEVGRAAGEAVRIDVIRWSTDEERQTVVSALGGGDKALAEALGRMPSLGYVWTGDSAGYFVRFAHRVPLAGGGERVIIATDRHLGSWGGAPWRVQTEKDAAEDPFTVVELRLTEKGTGEGKLSIATKAVANTEAQTIELDNYAAAPVLLKDVARAG